MNLSLPSPRTPPAAGAVPLRLQDLLRPLVLFLALVTVLGAFYFSPLRAHLQQARDLRETLAASGPWAPLFFIAAVWLLVACGVPRLLFCPLGGLAFGFWPGLLWTQAGTLLGCYTTFLFVRWGGRHVLLRCWPRAARLPLLSRPPSALSVFALRQVPVTGIVINCVLALSAVRHRAFLLGTACGLLPQAIPATLVGSSALHASRSVQGLLLAGALLLFALFMGLRRRASRLLFDGPSTAPE